EEISPTGQPFDPACMEAMSVIPVTDPAQDNTVLATLKPGYRIGDREVRPALVQVGRKSA
ncbi:MAG: nucleotide exchange factor GrpE, partial [Myxococcota bacterium]|nr:nucleotide exchange factor GrpE [Myxococcota bacterium]